MQLFWGQVGCAQRIACMGVHTDATWQIRSNDCVRRLWVGLPPGLEERMVFKLLCTMLPLPYNIAQHHRRLYDVVPTSFAHWPNSGPTSGWSGPTSCRRRSTSARPTSARRRPAIGPMSKWRRHDVGVMSRHSSIFSCYCHILDRRCCRQKPLILPLFFVFFTGVCLIEQNMASIWPKLYKQYSLGHIEAIFCAVEIKPTKSAIFEKTLIIS